MRQACIFISEVNKTLNKTRTRVTCAAAVVLFVSNIRDLYLLLLQGPCCVVSILLEGLAPIGGEINSVHSRED